MFFFWKDGDLAHLIVGQWRIISNYVSQLNCCIVSLTWHFSTWLLQQQWQVGFTLAYMTVMAAVAEWLNTCPHECYSSMDRLIWYLSTWMWKSDLTLSYMTVAAAVIDWLDTCSHIRCICSDRMTQHLPTWLLQQKLKIEFTLAHISLIAVTQHVPTWMLEQLWNIEINTCPDGCYSSNEILK